MVFDFAEGLDGPIYLDPNNPNHQAAIEQLRATRKPAVPYAVSPIGRMRDLGDPNDSRRGQSAPQSRSVPGLPDPIETLIESARADNSVTADTPIPGPSQTPARSKTNTGYIDREFGIQRGFGSGTAAQTEPPLSGNYRKDGTIDLEDGRRESVGPSASRPVISSNYRTAVKNPNPESPSKPRSPSSQPKQVAVNASLQDLERELLAAGASLDEARAFLADYNVKDETFQSSARGGRELTRQVLTQRPGEVVKEGDSVTRVVQTNNRQKPERFSGLRDDEIDEMYRGSKPVPNSTGKEIAPYYTVNVPVRGTDGRLAGVKRIDPRGSFVTLQADSETIRNAKHASEEEITTSNARAAQQVRAEQRTPLITGKALTEGLRNGSVEKVNGEGNHVANLISVDENGSTIRTQVFAIPGQQKGPEAKYRVGRPTNIDMNAARNALNPRPGDIGKTGTTAPVGAADEATDFGTQVVRTGVVVKRDADGNPIPDARSGKLARTLGKAVEVGPTTFLNRDEVDRYIQLRRREVEDALDIRGKRGQGPKLDHLSEGVRARIEQALAGRPQGGTREERIAADTISPFVQTDAEGRPFVRTNDLATPLVGFEQAAANLDQVLGELASGGYMADPSVANGFQRMAIEVEAGRLPMEAIPERARAAVAQEISVLRAAQAPKQRVPIQSEPVITERVFDNEADLVAEEINGPARNFDGEGRVVQGQYGDMGDPTVDGQFIRGFREEKGPDLEFSPEYQLARRVVDQQFSNFYGYDGKTSLESQLKLQQLSQQALADAVAATPAPFVSADNKEFQMQVQRSVANLYSQTVSPVKVLQGRSMPIRAADNQAATEVGSAFPQTQAAGVVNTDTVSQLNAPSSPVPRDKFADPETSALIDDTAFLNQLSQNSEVSTRHLDNIRRGLQPGASSASARAAQGALKTLRMRYGR